MPSQEVGRQINVASAAHGQVFYDHIDANDEPRGINGPMFTRKVCGGANMNGALTNPDDFVGRHPHDKRDTCHPWQTLVGRESVEAPWPGMPLGLNVRVPTAVRKGDLVRASMHYRSKHDPRLPPTNSTLGQGSGWTGGVGNLDGFYPLADSEAASTGTFGTFGKTLGSYKADPNKFLKSYEKHPALRYPTKFTYTDVAEPRPRPPRRDEIAPPKGSSQTDFVTKNQVDAILRGNKALGGSWIGERRRNNPQGVDPTSGGFGVPPPFETIGKITEQHGKGSKGGITDLVAAQLEAARRADIEAVVRGQSVASSERQSRMKTIKKLQRSVARAQSTEPHAAAKAPLQPSRPATVMSTYEDMQTARSAAPSEYLGADGKIVTRMPEDVRRHMIRALKRRWDEVNKEYQLLNLSLFNLDTVHKVNKKEACEAIMSRIEKDVMRLSKGTVFLQNEEQPSRPHSVAR